MWDLFILFLFVAFVCAIVAAMGKCPVWVPVMVTIVALLVKFWPNQ